MANSLFSKIFSATEKTADPLGQDPAQVLWVGGVKVAEVDNGSEDWIPIVRSSSGECSAAFEALTEALRPGHVLQKMPCQPFVVAEESAPEEE